MRYVLFALSAVLMGSSFSVQAKMYKWVDENGQMHFGDKIPEKYLVREHDEINAKGVVVRHKEAAKTAEQRRQEHRLELEKKQAALLEKKKKQRDRVLLDTYTTMRDLIVARDSRLDAVASQIRLSESIIVDSNKKIETMEKRVAKIQASNRTVPPDLYRRIDNEKQQVAVQSEVKKNHEKRRQDISVQFNDYIERFKALKAEQQAKREKLEKERGY